MEALGRTLLNVVSFELLLHKRPFGHIIHNGHTAAASDARRVSLALRIITNRLAQYAVPDRAVSFADKES